jgi:hypothetical protein
MPRALSSLLPQHARWFDFGRGGALTTVQRKKLPAVEFVLKPFAGGAEVVVQMPGDHYIEPQRASQPISARCKEDGHFCPFKVWIHSTCLLDPQYCFFINSFFVR